MSARASSGVGLCLAVGALALLPLLVQLLGVGLSAIDGAGRGAKRGVNDTFSTSAGTLFSRTSLRTYSYFSLPLPRATAGPGRGQTLLAAVFALLDTRPMPYALTLPAAEATPGGAPADPPCQRVNTVPYAYDSAALEAFAARANYRADIYVDAMPVIAAGADGVWYGVPLAAVDSAPGEPARVRIYTHYDFSLTLDARGRVMHVLVDARHTDPEDPCGAASEAPTTPATPVIWSYTLRIERSNVPYERRWDFYTRATDTSGALSEMSVVVLGLIVCATMLLLLGLVLVSVLRNRFGLANGMSELGAALTGHTSAATAAAAAAHSRSGSACARGDVALGVFGAEPAEARIAARGATVDADVARCTVRSDNDDDDGGAGVRNFSGDDGDDDDDDENASLSGNAAYALKRNAVYAFAAPSLPTLFAALVGTGTQVALVILLSLGVAVAAAQPWDGTWMRAAVLTLFATGSIAGYVARYLTGQYGARAHVALLALLALLLPLWTGALIMATFIIDLASPRAGLVGALVAIALALALADVLLLAAGMRIAARTAVPVRAAPVGSVPRRAPRPCWRCCATFGVAALTNTAIVGVMGVYLVIYTLQTFFNSHARSRSIVCFVIALLWLVTTACIGAISAYYLVTVGQTRNWWWHTFGAAGSPAAVLWAVGLAYLYGASDLAQPGDRVLLFVLNCAVSGTLFITLGSVAVLAGWTFLSSVVFRAAAVRAD